MGPAVASGESQLVKSSRTSPVLLSVICCSALLAGCGGGPTSASGDPSGNEAAAAALRLAALTDLDQRVARVAWRLSEANVGLCPVVRRSAGWALHSARQYSPALRFHAETRFGLKGDLPGVLAAPAGSPAAAAALQTGDLLLAIGGAPLQAGPPGGAASYDGLEANLRLVDAALADGAATFTVQRGAEVLDLTIQSRRACGYEVQLNPSDELNARADGRRLFISTALAGFTESDDELALILGHELAHHVLRHRHWSATGGAARHANEEVWAVEGGEGQAEQQADRVGLYLMARAGFDPAVAAPFWRRFGESNWRVRFPQIGHASAGSRARAMR